MLDIKFIRENSELVKKNCANRLAKCDIDKLLEKDKEKRLLETTIDKLRAERNKLSGPHFAKGFVRGKQIKNELKLLGVVIPEIKKDIPRIKMREAQQIILERTKRDNTKEPDLTPEDEKEICEWAKEIHNSEVIFITHYPTKKRPFYTMPDPENPDYTLSFDILLRGLEITTGGQRINNYSQLVENIKKWGNKPEDFEFYLQAFKYGMPNEGGFAFGAERIVKQILGLENLRQASAFPRDMSRIDGRLKLNE